jgi:hypothetical protein
MMLVDEKRRQTDPLSPRSQPGDCACRSSASAATIDAESRPHSGQAIKSRMHCGVGVMRVSCHDMPAEQAEAPQHEFITRCWPSQEKAQPLDQLRRSRGPSSRDLTSGPAHLLPLPPSLAPLVRLPSTPASRDQLVTFQARSTTVDRLPIQRRWDIGNCIWRRSQVIPTSRISSHARGRTCRAPAAARSG